ncbi:MAG: FMN-binding negative transcriptional regulator [Cryobacterium sp.]|nr:FMN-binding negative transcriptional regulator [Cryobacterium sp.]
MRYTPHFVTTDPEEVMKLIRENPWSTIVANTSKGLVATHYPVLLEENLDEISIVGHVGRPEERTLELGNGEWLVVIQGAHGYISPGWYGEIPAVPTWNHSTAHLYGVPEVLSDDENWAVLDRMVEHFEHVMPHPKLLKDNEEYGRSIFDGTVGFRMRVTRFEARLKLSQNKSDSIKQTVIGELDHGAHYSQPRLAADMTRVNGIK